MLSVRSCVVLLSFPIIYGKCTLHICPTWSYVTLKTMAASSRWCRSILPVDIVASLTIFFAIRRLQDDTHCCDATCVSDSVFQTSTLLLVSEGLPQLWPQNVDINVVHYCLEHGLQQHKNSVLCKINRWKVKVRNHFITK